MSLEKFISAKKAEYKKDQETRYTDGVRKLLSSEEAIEVFRRILENACVFTSCFTGNSTTFYNEGKRDVGLNLLSDIMRADGEAIGKIFKIHAEIAKREKELENIWIKEFDDGH